MRAGKLNRTLTLQSRSISQDEYGQEVEVWTTQETVRAERLQLTGREYLKNGVEISETKAVYRIRYRASLAIDNKWRVLENGLAYDILSVTEIDLREGLELLCQRAV